MSKFLIVYEDEWHTKYAFQTKSVSKTIRMILTRFQLEAPEIDNDLLNIVDVGTYGPLYDDIYVRGIEDVDCDEYRGRISIFTLPKTPPLLEFELCIAGMIITYLLWWVIQR